MLGRYGTAIKCSMGVLAGALWLVPISSDAAQSQLTYEYAGHLVNDCSAENMTVKSECVGFITGVLEVASNGPIYGVTACIPKLLPLQQVIGLTQQWITAHPESNTWPGSAAIIRALAEAFPCKK